MALNNSCPDWLVPDNSLLWDPWFVITGTTTHAFYLLQEIPAGMARWQVGRSRPVIGHATWSNEAGWIDHGIAIDYTGHTYDEARIHTGCVFKDPCGYKMFYSGSNHYICEAYSRNLGNWTKSAENPILSPDPSLYLPGWRDPWLLQEDVGNATTLIIAAQQAGVEGLPIGAVAVVHQDESHVWHQTAPLNTPPWFQWMEVPELHFLAGMWYLLFATRAKWITDAGRSAFQARGLRVQDGPYYLMSDNWRGPFVEIGSLGNLVPYAYTTRLVKRSVDGLWLWSHVEIDASGAVVFGLQPPVACVVLAEGGLGFP